MLIEMIHCFLKMSMTWNHILDSLLLAIDHTWKTLPIPSYVTYFVMYLIWITFKTTSENHTNFLKWFMDFSFDTSLPFANRGSCLNVFRCAINRIHFPVAQESVLKIKLDKHHKLWTRDLVFDIHNLLLHLCTIHVPF